MPAPVPPERAAQQRWKPQIPLKDTAGRGQRAQMCFPSHRQSFKAVAGQDMGRVFSQCPGRSPWPEPEEPCSPPVPAQTHPSPLFQGLCRTPALLPRFPVLPILPSHPHLHCCSVPLEQGQGRWQEEDAGEQSYSDGWARGTRSRE